MDYRATTEAANSTFHTSLYHLPTGDNRIFGAFQVVALGPHQLFTSCPLYDPSVAIASPASRAGDFMHEGWPAWLSKYHWDNGLRRRTSSLYPQPGRQLHQRRLHRELVRLLQLLWHRRAPGKPTAPPAAFIQPNQMQVEFLCDVFDQPQAWVPASDEVDQVTPSGGHAIRAGDWRAQV